MRFTWVEAACILTIAIAALSQSGERGSGVIAPQAAQASRASIMADLKPSQRQREFGNERISALHGR